MKGVKMWRGHSCLQRRDSSRRSRSALTRSTIDSPSHAEPVPPSPGSLRYRLRCAATRLRAEPNGRTARLARMFPRCGPGSNSPASPWIPLEIAVAAMARSSAGEVREYDWRGWHTLPNHSDPTVRRAAKTPRQPALWAPEPDIRARCASRRETDPSKRRRRPRKAYGEEGTLREEGCREDATSQTAIFLPDSGGGDGGENLAYQEEWLVRWEILTGAGAPRRVLALQTRVSAPRLPGMTI